jgi:hypothetical protein
MFPQGCDDAIGIVSPCYIHTATCWALQNHKNQQQDNNVDCHSSALNNPWTLVSVREHLWVTTEHAECLWVCVNTNEWAGTSPEHPLSAHEWLWVSLQKVWMCTSRVVNLKIYMASLNWEFEHCHTLNLMLRVKNMHTFLGPSSRYVWYFLTSTIYLTCKKIVWKTSGLQKIWCIKRLILSQYF